MSIKQKLRNALGAHPRLVNLGIGLGITFGVALLLGGLIESAEAINQSQSNTQSSN